MRLDDLIADPPGPAQHDHRGARHDHTISRDPLTGDWDVSGVWSATLPESVDEWTASVKAAGLGIPDGYIVEMIEAKYDPLAWGRPDPEQKLATTQPVWRCRYKVMRDPRVELDRVAALLSDKPRKRARTRKSMDARAIFVAPCGDLQAGKVDGGGTEAIVTRYTSEVERTVLRYQQQAANTPVCLPQLGDCIEGHLSAGGASKGRSDLPVDAQVEVYARLLEHTIDAYLDAGAPSVLVPAVPGNHDETSRSGKAVDVAHDSSWALLAVRLLARIYRKDERVAFLLPEADTMTVTLELGGMVVALAHGHQFRGGWDKWWAGQASGRTRAGDADLLLAGHLHHLRVQDFGGGRTFLQVPALDGGSQWYTEQAGDQTRSRAVSFVIRDGRVHDLDPVS